MWGPETTFNTAIQSLPTPLPFPSSQAIQAFVRQSITYIDHAPDQDTKVALIKTLQAVTEGKVCLQRQTELPRQKKYHPACTFLQIFVEIERARLTRRLATIREAEGNINDAADTMQEVPVVSNQPDNQLRQNFC